MSFSIDKYWTSENFSPCNFLLLLTYSIVQPKTEKIIPNTIDYV